MKKVLVIVGPTAVGKTALSIQLAKKYHGEIISGDSMQIYRQLDIGTAKVTKEEMAGIPHHLIDIRGMTEAYSAADFQQMGRILADGGLLTEDEVPQARRVLFAAALTYVAAAVATLLQLLRLIILFGNNNRRN